jgi:hypothetical protein
MKIPNPVDSQVGNRVRVRLCVPPGYKVTAA